MPDLHHVFWIAAVALATLTLARSVEQRRLVVPFVG
jgi:hypothetical protein